MQPGLFRLGGICFLPLAGGAPYTEGGAHGVPLWGMPAGLRPRRVPAAQPPERAPHPSKCGKTAYMHRLRITVSCFLRRAAMHVSLREKTIFRLKEKEYAERRVHAPAGFLFGQA